MCRRGRAESRSYLSHSMPPTALVPLLVLLATALAPRPSAAAAPPPPVRERSTAGRRIVVVGAGYAGLAAACELAALGYSVTVVDRLGATGGRAQRTERPGGFAHDAGPSWYWMPEVFDMIFSRLGRRREDLYNLTRLDPAYRVFLAATDAGVAIPPFLDVPGTLEGFKAFALRLDPAADVAGFLEDGARKYDLGVREAIWHVPNPALPVAAWMTAASPELVSTSLAEHIARYARSPRLRAVLGWPSQFLGLDAARTPALYALLSWSGHAQGTWLPSAAEGGMAAPARALERVARELGVCFELGAGAEAVRIDATTDRRRVARIALRDGRVLAVEGIVAAADYAHVELALLPPALRRHSAAFWAAATLTPPVVIFSLCVTAPVPALALTHSLFLDNPDMPFYASSNRGGGGGAVGDDGEVGVGRAARTSVFVLVPLFGSDALAAAEEVAAAGAAAGAPAVSAQVAATRAAILARVLARLGLRAADIVCGAEGFGPAEYARDFNALRGNAFGLASTLAQTMSLRPPMDSLAENLAFCGHLTHPGPGVPPALVSGVLAARLLHAQLEASEQGPWVHAPALTFVLVLAALAALAHSRTARDALALHRSGRTYFAAAAAMPVAEFMRTAALYAIFRRADDLVDSAHANARTRRADLDAFAAQVMASHESRLGHASRLWLAFFGAMRADAVADAAREAAVAGAVGVVSGASAGAGAGAGMNGATLVGTVAGGLVCATQAELVAYMEGSAAVLGEFMLPVLGGGAALAAPARALGRAFQLTNMLRDVREDAARGRQYVPADACTRHGLVGAPGDADAADPRFRALMEEMFELADTWYAEADAGIALLPERTRGPIALARRVYHRLHDAIRAAGYALEPRITVPLWRKLADAAALLPPSQALRIALAEAALCLVGAAADWAASAATLCAVWLVAEALEAPAALTHGGPVSYAAFHVLWTLPLLALLLGFVAARRGCLCRRGVADASPAAYSGHAGDGTLALKWVMALCALAVVYTTPWDARLISLGVWASAPDLVSGTLWRVPLEEFVFFVGAALLSCLTWLAVWPLRWRDAPRAAPPARAAGSLVTALLLLVLAFGACCAAAGGRLTYLGELLLWATPVLLLQWQAGGHVLSAHAGPLARVVLLGGVGLALADRWAIRRNVWVLNPERSLPPWSRGLHVEEVLFFLAAVAMCAGGLTLALWHEHGFEPRLRGADFVARTLGDCESAAGAKAGCGVASGGGTGAMAGVGADGAVGGGAVHVEPELDDPFPLPITKARRSHSSGRRRH